jgi:hypothetical protein
MTRRSLKMATLGLVGFIAFSALAYLLVSSVILVSCNILHYILTQPENALIIILNGVALGWMIQMLYTKYKK